MSLVNATAARSNVNQLPNQTPRTNQHARQEPTVQNTKGRLQTTDVAKASQLTGDQSEVQRLDTQANATNPLTSPQQSIHNQRVAAGGF